MTVRVPVARVDEFPPGTMRGVDHGGEKYVVANVDGTFHGLEGICSHEYADLAGGFLATDQIVCPLHASAFDVRTGEVLGPPATEPIAVFPVEVSEGIVYLLLPEELGQKSLK